MRRAGLPDVQRPSPLELLLLRAALLEPEAAAKAWAELRPRFDLDTMGGDHLGLFPMIYTNLVAGGIEDPDLGRLKGILRRNWVRNQQRVGDLVDVVTILGEAGISVIALNDMPVGSRDYDDLAARFMGDVDVLVPRDDAASALRVLRRSGWEVLTRARHGWALPHDDEWYLRVRHAAYLQRTDIVLHLHWLIGRQFLSDASRISDMTAFWDAAEPMTIGDVQTLAMCPADQLLSTCTNAMDSPFATKMWVADALNILRSDERTIDWNRLLEQAARRDSTLAMRDALTFVVEELDAPVPTSALARLWTTPVGRRERFGRALSTRSPASIFGSAARLAGTHLRQTTDAGTASTVGAFPAHVRDYAGVERMSELPPLLAQKLRGRAATIVRRRRS
jgi:Uncharacterised nucleotidyltransferase